MKGTTQQTALPFTSMWNISYDAIRELLKAIKLGHFCFQTFLSRHSNLVVLSETEIRHFLKCLIHMFVSLKSHIIKSIIFTVKKTLLCQQIEFFWM